MLEKAANGLGTPAAVPVPHEWSFQFETPEALHFRSPETTRLDETFGDIHTDLRDVQAAVMRQVEVEVRSAKQLAPFIHENCVKVPLISSTPLLRPVQVLAREAALLQAARVLGVLDAFLSLASVAEVRSPFPPTLVYSLSVDS